MNHEHCWHDQPHDNLQGRVCCNCGKRQWRIIENVPIPIPGHGKFVSAGYMFHDGAWRDVP